MTDYLTLKNSQLEVVLNPSVGLGLMAFNASIGDAWLPITPDARLDSCPLTESSFVMVPYSNRIEDGKFSFEGKEYQIDPTWLHSIHGDVKDRPWTILSQTEDEIVAKFDSAEHLNVNWPWPFEVRQIYRITDNRLSMTLALWNRGESNMPAGFGWHPYFSQHLTREGEPVHLLFDAMAVYPDANDTRLPTGPVQPIPPHRDFGHGMMLPDEFFDICLHGYNGRGKITWPDSKVQLQFDCSPENQHLVMYNPSEPFFAIEPVTNANNGVNLLANGSQTSGIVSLAPNQCLTATFDLIVVENPDPIMI